MELVHHIRDVAERQRHGIRDPVAHSQLVQRCRKFAGLRGGHEEDDHRDGCRILEDHICMIQQLLCRDAVSSDQVYEHRPGAVQADPVLRGKQIDQQVIEEQKDQGKDQDHLHFPHPDLRHPKQHQSADRKEDQVAGVEGDHGRQNPAEHTRQLGRPCQSVDRRNSVDIIK